MTRCAPALVALVAVAGCAGDRGVYPSLAPRAIEARGFAEPAPAAAVTAADPQLDRRLAELAGRLETIAGGFNNAATTAERQAAAARGRAAGSDAWLDAQTALAALDDWRAQASALATDVEAIAIARGAELVPDYPALTALGTRAEAEATRQTATIARIQATLAPA